MALATQLGLTAIERYDQYHKLLTTCEPAAGSCTGLIKKFAALITAPVVYPSLYIAAKIIAPYISPSIQSAEQLGQYVQTALSTLGPHKRNEAIQLIRRSRLDTLFEIFRLREAGALTPERLHRLEKTISQVWYKGLPPPDARRRAAILFGQAFEIKELYKETHFVFLHAQAVPWMIYSSLVKSLVRQFHPKLDIHNFKFLRLPPADSRGNFLNKLIGKVKDIVSLSDRVQAYLWKKSRKVDDEKRTTMEKLLSVDGYFFNNYYEESASHFLLNNYNIVDKPDKIMALSERAIKEFCPKVPYQLLQGIMDRIRRAWAASKDAPCGNLFALCVPKDKVDQVVYRAHPFGMPCQCHPSDKSKQILKSLQQEMLPDGAKCLERGWGDIPIPQYRLYLPQVQAGSGIDIHCLSPLARSVKQQMKMELAAIAKELHDLKT